MPLREGRTMPIPVLIFQYKYRHPKNNRYILVHFGNDWSDEANINPIMTELGIQVGILHI
jgi:hypothetical protein